MQGIYQQDPYLLQYRSLVTGSVSENGRNGIFLENTIFYPEGGGQPADSGTLVCARRSYEVLHVEERADGIVHWLAGTAAPEIGTTVFMAVDVARRRDHMQQHHGQHILSAILEQKHGWQTIGFHLGEETVTIDLTTRDIAPELLREVEEEVNHIVMENLPVKVENYRREELPESLLQKIPGDEEEIRLVIIPGIDENACCGTHPRSTGEVGPVKIVKTEKVRGNLRLHFICGSRTIRWMGQTAITLRNLEQAIGATGSEALSRLEKREAELKKLHKERKELLLLKYRWEAEQQESCAAMIGSLSVLVQHFAEADMEMLRGIAAVWCEKPGRLAVLAGGCGPSYDVVMAKGQAVSAAVNTLAVDIWPLLKGKGGGSPDIVQGKASELPLNEVKKRLAEALV
ncbi:alanyl-tRNA editing protein [Desulforamulus aeronauticus]|uniref:alanyl-tRNA editing protein n=1 Tax=Desulforamulus aeronauticus TaxID=53343 RepID=UPI000933E2D2|nr:alanyl-tRNA editing protein [Desulforamulus aeronauticus]